MKVSYDIAKKVEGTLDEVLATTEGVPVTLDELVTALKNVTFIAETVAHLQGKEREILPTTDKARELIKKLGME